MTNPPPPGNWGPPQPGPQPPYGQGPAQYGPPPGQWPPQQGWGQPQPPKNSGLKWLLIGVAVLLVIAITIGATLLFTRDGGDDPPTATGNASAAGDIASADDTGPVTVITEDPTCEPSRPITDTLAQVQRQGWDQRDHTVPATDWSPEDKKLHEDIADAMRSAASQTEALTKKTPHRVMRELYEQSIFFWRSYADSVRSYTPVDNYFAMAATSASGAIVSICSAIDRRSAPQRGPLVEDGPAPLQVGESALGESFISTGDKVTCAEWKNASDQFDTDATAWLEIDPNVPASEWTRQQRETMVEIGQRMSQYADQLEELGSRSDNAELADFASLGAQYWRAYVAAIPSYDAADSYLSATAAYSTYLVVNACSAFGE